MHIGIRAPAHISPFQKFGSENESEIRNVIMYVQNYINVILFFVFVERDGEIKFVPFPTSQ